MNRAQSSTEEPTYDKACQLTFKSWMEYHCHKLATPRRHITCEVCSQDFKTLDARKRHHDLNHAHEQDLECPGCGERFPRLGGLISHIELTECRSIPKQRFDSGRTERTEWHRNYQNARNFRDYGRTAGDFSDSPNPLIRPQPSSLLDIQDDVVSTPSATHADTEPANITSSNDCALDESDDLINFDDATAVLNSPWGAPVPQPPKKPSHPPAARALQAKTTNLMDAPLGELKSEHPQSRQFSQPMTGNLRGEAPAFQAGNAWAKPLNVAPNAPAKLISGFGTSIEGPAAAAPPIDLMESISLSHNAAPVKATPVNPFDPDSPDFKASKYYIEFLQRYKCPYTGCGKTNPSLPAFIAHLKSPAHRKEKLQCERCLRYFDTATALTQHSEAQGIRCKVRETDGYHGVVDHITAGTALVAGRHVDNTIKYVTKAQAQAKAGSVVTDIVAQHRQKMADNEDYVNNYWAIHTPKW